MFFASSARKRLGKSTGYGAHPSVGEESHSFLGGRRDPSHQPDRVSSYNVRNEGRRKRDEWRRVSDERKRRRDEKKMRGGEGGMSGE